MGDSAMGQAVRAVAVAALLLCAGSCAESQPRPLIASIRVTPGATSLQVATSRQLSATVSGADVRVLWRLVEPQSSGTISPDGLYTAPSRPGIFHVVATSLADPSMSASSTLEVIDVPAMLSSVVVTQHSPTVRAGSTFQFGALLDGSVTSAVAWSVAPGGAGGTIDSIGLYTAPAGEGSDTIIATSLADGRQQGRAQVAVSAPAGAREQPVELTALWRRGATRL